MFRLRNRNCCWFFGLLTLINGVCVTTLSAIMFDQTLFLLLQQRSQRADAFAHVYNEPFKNSNWMKSAIPLVVAATLGILIGVFQSVTSLISLIMDNSKSVQVRKLGWLIWIAAGMCIFTLSVLSFALAVILKAHESRDPKDSISFWDNYRFSSKVTHNFEGHAFCSALACNSAFILASIAVVAANVFHQQESPHLLLGM